MSRKGSPELTLAGFPGHGSLKQWILLATASAGPDIFWEMTGLNKVFHFEQAAALILSGHQCFLVNIICIDINFMI
jgi:hypothetical protein